MSELQSVGQRLNPVDGPEKVDGKAKYVADYQLPGMLIAKVLRSPYPHARITKLDVSPALEVPGVINAITPADFVDNGNLGWPVKDAYVLAFEKVRHVGDPVAAVAAETVEAALAGLAAIIVEYEELPAVTDMEAALEPDAPLVPLEETEEGEGNRCLTQIVRNGDSRAALADSAVVLEQSYYCAHQEHAYLETEGVMAIPGPDGGITVYANDQSPFLNRDNLVMLLGLPEDKVRVIQAVVGGSFGGKDDIGYLIAAQAAKLALKSQRPVRLSLTREESILSSYKREAMLYHVKLGANEDGALKAAYVEALADSGAYSSMTPLSAWRATVHAAGAYRYDAVEVDTHIIYTNNSYSGAFRGFGNTQSACVIEQAIDELAAHFKRDPIDYRLQNCLQTGDRAMTGHVIKDEVALAACLEWVRDHSDWNRKHKAYANQPDGAEVKRGIGVACYFHGASLGGEGADYATATLKIEDDYGITLTSGLTDYGQGSRTVLTLIAAELLGVDPDRISMLRPDTQRSIESGPTVASRTTMVGGNATHIAAAKLDRTLTHAAASLLKCATAQVIRDGENYIGPGEEPLLFEQIVDHAREMGLILSTNGHWAVPLIEWDFETGTGDPYFCYVFGAQVVELEVDTRTGATDILNVYAAHDAGKIVFPQGADGQMLGGIAQGIGYALTEDCGFDQGYPIHTSYDGYLLPTTLDMPNVEIEYIETTFEDGPYGAKNLAEPVMIATAPAILNALAQATGVRYRRVPVTLEHIVLGRGLMPSDAKQRVHQALDFKE